MQTNISLPASLLLLATTAAAQTLTPAERDRALQYLGHTRAGLVDSVKGLSEVQLNFKPGPDRWSVAEVVEHLALIEDLVHGILGNLDKAPAPAANRDFQQLDTMIMAKVPDRSTKLHAPEGAVPTGRWTTGVALDRFLASRAEIVTILKTTPDLRAHSISHPALGPLDGYQWILALAAHSERHTKQILEVKADPNFPRD